MLGLCILSALGIEDPTRDQSAGAFVIAETVLMWRATLKKR